MEVEGDYRNMRSIKNREIEHDVDDDNDREKKFLGEGRRERGERRREKV